MRHTGSDWPLRPAEWTAIAIVSPPMTPKRFFTSALASPVTLTSSEPSVSTEPGAARHRDALHLAGDAGGEDDLRRLDALGDARRGGQDRSGKDRSVERLLIGDAGRADIAVGDRRPDGRQADRQDDGGEDHGTARLVSEEGGHRARHGAALGHET